VSRQIATFLVGDTLLGLDILLVKEVHRHLTLTPVPGAPNHLSGLMNLRGRVVTVIDLGVCLQLPDSESSERKLLILKTDAEIAPYQMKGNLEKAQLGEDIVGFLIDRMEEVLTVEDSEVLPSPPNLAVMERKLIDGVVKQKNRLVILLDVTAVLSRVMTVATVGESVT
jgi:purine-binding chemotaxis protein CheW